MTPPSIGSAPLRVSVRVRSLIDRGAGWDILVAGKKRSALGPVGMQAPLPSIIETTSVRLIERQGLNAADRSAPFQTETISLFGSRPTWAVPNLDFAATRYRGNVIEQSLRPSPLLPRFWMLHLAAGGGFVQRGPAGVDRGAVRGSSVRGDGRHCLPSNPFRFHRRR